VVVGNWHCHSATALALLTARNHRDEDVAIAAAAAAAAAATLVTTPFCRAGAGAGAGDCDCDCDETCRIHGNVSRSEGRTIPTAVVPVIIHRSILHFSFVCFLVPAPLFFQSTVLSSLSLSPSPSSLTTSLPL